MKQDLINKGYIPLDKSWMIRIGVLDLVHGYDDCVKFLEQQYDALNDDLQSLHQASLHWKEGRSIDVGASGTLYRFLRFASWKLREDRTFILQGTLKKRTICNDPSIVDWTLEQLLQLDHGTSQWASASVLMGNEERIHSPPYKLQLTYDTVDHWKTARKHRKHWK